jgi:hypothetical protein
MGGVSMRLLLSSLVLILLSFNRMDIRLKLNRLPIWKSLIAIL